MRICVVDDEKNIRRSIQLILENEGHEVTLCPDSIKAYEVLKEQEFDLAILDIRLNDNIDGIGLFRKLRAQNISVPVIFISGNASLSEASQCVREGAYDFVEKPVSAEKLLSLVERCYDYYSLQKRYRDLMEKKSGQNIEQGQEEQVKLIGDSVITNGLKDQLIKISLASSPTIHLKGDLGVGKRMIARFIYQHRSRKEWRDFQSFSALSLNKKMLSFDQLTDLQGFILIENVENLSASSQGDLLNLIQRKVFCDKLRLITTSVKDLNEEENFSQELFYALSSLNIYIPNLLERSEDIPLWAQYFVSKTGKEKRLSEVILKKIRLKSWSGNLLELKNTIDQWVLMSGLNPLIDESVLPLSFDKEAKEEKSRLAQTVSHDSTIVDISNGPLTALKDFREQAERNYILRVLKQERGNVTRSAQVLDIERTFLHKKMVSLGIEKKDYF